MTPARAALRDGTRAEHDALDALFAGFDLADRASYARFLAAHAEAGLPVEAALDGATALVPDWPERTRGAALAADLGALGFTIPVRGEERLSEGEGSSRTTVLREGISTSSMPPQHERNQARLDLAPIAPLTDPAAIAGALYVLEGSRLGGRVLARAVAPGLPVRYLMAHQRQGAWPDLIRQLEAILNDQDRQARAVVSARMVFARFASAGERWLRGE